MVFLFSYRLYVGMFTDIFIMFHRGDTVRAIHALEVTDMQITKLIKAYLLSLAALITANLMEEESPSIVLKKFIPAVQARNHRRPGSELKFCRTDSATFARQGRSTLAIGE